MNDQNQFDASKLEELEDSPRHISIWRHIYFVYLIIWAFGTLTWIFLNMWENTLRSLPYLKFIASKSVPLAEVILA